MSFLDGIFKNPQNDAVVHIGLYRIYWSQMVSDAQNNKWSEAKLAQELKSLPNYLKFLGELNDTVVQEISDVSNNLYGPIDGRS